MRGLPGDVGGMGGSSEPQQDRPPAAPSAPGASRDQKNSRGRSRSASQVAANPRAWSSLLSTAGSPQALLDLTFVEPVVHGSGKAAVFDANTSKEIEEAWPFAIMGYCVGLKPAYTPLSQFIQRAWHVKGHVDLMMREGEFFVCVFNLEEDMHRVLEGFWAFRGHPLILRKWSPDLEMEKERLTSIPVWIRLPSLPLAWWSVRGLSQISSLIGKPLRMDHLTASRKRLQYARVCILVEAGDILPKTVTVINHRGLEESIHVQYEWIPKLCKHCKLFGHATSDCSLGSSATKQPSEKLQSTAPVHNRAAAGGTPTNPLVSTATPAIGTTASAHSPATNSAAPTPRSTLAHPPLHEAASADLAKAPKNSARPRGKGTFSAGAPKAKPPGNFAKSKSAAALPLATAPSTAGSNPLTRPPIMAPSVTSATAIPECAAGNAESHPIACSPLSETANPEIAGVENVSPMAASNAASLSTVGYLAGSASMTSAIQVGTKLAAPEVTGESNLSASECSDPTTLKSLTRPSTFGAPRDGIDHPTHSKVADVEGTKSINEASCIVGVTGPCMTAGDDSSCVVFGGVHTSFQDQLREVESKLISAAAEVASATTVLPQDYWKQMLPNTPMPIPVRDLFLRPAADVKSTTTASADAAGEMTASAFVFIANHLPATKEELSNEANADIFFLEKDLHPGATRKLHFTRRTAEAAFVPRPVADAFPFSTAKLPEILSLFSVNADSKEAEDMKMTLLPCDAVEPGESKLCATSLESMVDFAVSNLGTTEVQALSSEGVTKRQMYTVVPSAGAVESLVAEGENAIACHAQPYPYAVFFCHGGAGAAKVYRVKLVGEDGGRATAMAVCHTRTSGWHPKHLAFQVLKAKPGTTICHFLQQDNLVWVPRRQ